MNDNIIIRRRWDSIVHILVRASSKYEALSKASVCISLNPKDTALANIHRLEVEFTDRQEWFKLRASS